MQDRNEHSDLGLASVRLPRSQNKASTVGMYAVGAGLVAGRSSKLCSILFFLSSLLTLGFWTSPRLLADHFPQGGFGSGVNLAHSLAFSFALALLGVESTLCALEVPS